MTDPDPDPLDRLRGKWGFPAFARDFPPDPDLAALVESFTDGDYAAVREGAPALAARTKDEAVKRAAELLRARTEPDSASRWFFGLTAALLVFLFTWWVVHSGPSHHGVAPVKPPPTVEYVK